MLIALPNPGGDFTLTLFLPNEGRESFASLGSEAAVEVFFCRYFADVVPLIPGLVESFLTNPVGILGTVRCDGWHEGGRLLLIGDAAHAIVPFHGQGMNLAFEDCVVLDEAARTARNWEAAFAAFEERQLPNANAIADMALENYVEMRDTVRDPKYKLRKELSFELERRLPDRFIPRYSMVMFHEEIPYAVAQQRGAVQQALLDELVHDALALEEIDLSTAEELVRTQLPRLP
jgi:kynurenine 3-monooxygenase